MNLIGYLRVKEASGGATLTEQRESLQRHAASTGANLVETHEDPKGASTSLAREGLQLALVSLESGRAQGLLVHSLCRLTKNVRDLARLFEAYFASRFVLVSILDDLNTANPSDRRMLRLMLTLDLWRRDASSKQASDDVIRRSLQGQHIGAPALGFRVESGVLKPSASEQETVVRLLALHSEGLSFEAIANALNREALPTKRGGQWRGSTVRYFLNRFATPEQHLEATQGRRRREEMAATVARRIGDLRDQGLSFGKIARELNLEDFTTRLGKPWNGDRVRRMLDQITASQTPRTEKVEATK